LVPHFIHENVKSVIRVIILYPGPRDIQ